MNLRVVARMTSGLLALVALFMLVPLAIALWDWSLRSVFAYSLSLTVTSLTCAILRWLGRGAPTTLHRKDALGAVALTWIFVGLLGALPMLLDGSIRRVSSAVFEAVSGFTTTGATVVGDIDGLTRATNMWRCLSHWLGGMGIVVLFVAVFPELGVGAKHLFRAEVPGPITEGLRPKIKQTALALWWIYASLTALLTTLLMALGMDWFDAVCHAFSTLGTGGFSTRSASVGAFKNPAIEWVLTGFMLLSGLNFGLFYAAVRGRAEELFRNYELRFFLAVNLIVTCLVALSIAGRHGSFLEDIRYAAFQTAAVTSTAGFMTEDYETYPNAARFALFACMFMGGCAGSTAGGLKVSRVFALFKLLQRELRLVAQPSAVVRIRLGGSAVPAKVLESITIYVTSYMVVFIAASFIMVLSGLDILSAMSSVASCLSSIGPGLEKVGPTQNFEFINDSGKWVLIFCMIAGRLEILPLLSLFTREAWRR